jgi:Tfp pilus assembly protein PilV
MSRIFGQRRRAGDEGFTLIEAVVALSIAMLVLVALLGTISTLTVTQVGNRTRASATAIGAEMIERARALTFTKLAVLDDGTVPSTYVVNSTTYNVVKGTPCPGCLPYKQTRTLRGVDYSITQLVLSRSTYTNADGNPVTAKQIVVDVTWNKPRSARYSIQTIVNDTTPLDAPVIQGLRVEVHDADDALIEDDTVSWDVTISGGTSLTGTTEDGTWLNANLQPGSYTCTVATNATSAGYHVSGSPGVRSVTKACNVSAKTVTVSTTQWTDSDECPTGTGTGTLTVNVDDANAAPLSGAAVALTRVSDGVAITPVSSTNASGAVTYSGLVDGRYSYAVSKSGYTSPVTGSACVYASLTSSSDVTMLPAPSPGPSSTASAAPVTTATLMVSVTRKVNGGKDYVIRVQNAAVGIIDRPIYVGQGCTGTVTYEGLPYGTYTVTIYEKASNGSLNKKHDWTNQSLTSPSPPYSLSWTTGSGSQVCAA